MSGKFSSRLLVTTDKKHVTSSRCRTAFKGILVTLAIRPEPCLEKVVEDVSLEDGDRKRKAMYMVDDLLMTVLDRGHEAPQAMSVEKDYVFAFLYTVFQLDSRGSRPIDEWQDCLKAVASIYTPSPNISEQERMLQEEILLTMPKGDYSAAQRNFLKVALPRMIDPELRKIIDAKLEVLDGASEADMDNASGVTTFLSRLNPSQPSSDERSSSKLLSLPRNSVNIQSSEDKTFSKEELALVDQDPLLAHVILSDLISTHEVDSCETLEASKAAVGESDCSSSSFQSGSKAQGELDALVYQGVVVAKKELAQLVTMAGASNFPRLHQSILRIEDANLKTLALLMELAVRSNPHFIEELKLFQGTSWSDAEFQDFMERLSMALRTVDAFSLTRKQKELYFMSQLELADLVEKQKAQSLLTRDPDSVTSLGLLDSLQACSNIESRDVRKKRHAPLLEGRKGSMACGIHDYLDADLKAIVEVFRTLRMPERKFKESNAETLVKAYVSRAAAGDGGPQYTLALILKKLKECGYLATATALEMGLITLQTPRDYSLSNLRRVAAANARSKLGAFVNEANQLGMRLTQESLFRGIKLIFYAMGDAKHFDFTSLDALQNEPLQATLQRLALLLFCSLSEAVYWEERILQCDPGDVFALRVDIFRRFEELPSDINLPEPLRLRFVQMNSQASVGMTARQVAELENSFEDFLQSPDSPEVRLTCRQILDMVRLAIVKESVEDDSCFRICEVLKAQGHDDLLNALAEGLIEADILAGIDQDEAAAAARLRKIRNAITHNVNTELEAYSGLPHMSANDEANCDRLVRCLQYDHFNSLELRDKIAFFYTVLMIPHWSTASTAMAILTNNAEISSHVRHQRMTLDHGLLCLHDVPAELETHVQYMQLVVLTSILYNEDHRDALDNTLRQYIIPENATHVTSFTDCSRLLQLYLLTSAGVLKKIRQKGVTNLTRESLLQTCIENYDSFMKEPETSLQRQFRKLLPANVLNQVNSSEIVTKILEATSELKMNQLWCSLTSQATLIIAPLYKLCMTQDELTKYINKPSYFECFQTINQTRQIGAFNTFKEFTKRTFTKEGAMRHHLDEDGKVLLKLFNIAEDGAHLVKHLLFQKENSSLFSSQFCELFMHTWAAPSDPTRANAWNKILMSLVTEKDLPDSLKDKIMASESTTELINSITLTKEFKTFEVESGLAHLETAALRTMGSTLLSSSWFYPINGPGLMVSSATAQRAMKKLHLKPSELVTLIKAQPPNGPYAKMLTLLHNTISHTPTEPSSREHIKSVCEDFRAKVRAMKSSENTFRGFTRDYRDSNGRTISPIVFWEWIITEIHEGKQPCPTASASVSVSDLIQVLHWFPPTSKQDPLWRLRQVAYEVVAKALDKDGNLNEDFLREVAVDCHMQSRRGEKGLERVLNIIEEGKSIDCTVTKTPESEECWTEQLWIMLSRVFQGTRRAEQCTNDFERRSS